VGASPWGFKSPLRHAPGPRRKSGYELDFFTVLEPSLRPAVPQFLHQDAQISNVLVVGGDYRALIDWDDAGWSDPVVDLRYVPVLW